VSVLLLFEILFILGAVGATLSGLIDLVGTRGATSGERVLFRFQGDELTARELLGPFLTLSVLTSLIRYRVEGAARRSSRSALALVWSLVFLSGLGYALAGYYNGPYSSLAIGGILLVLGFRGGWRLVKRDTDPEGRPHGIESPP
jgi:uncharacterized membrane protein YfcA